MSKGDTRRALEVAALSRLFGNPGANLTTMFPQVHTPGTPGARVEWVRGRDEAIILYPTRRGVDQWRALLLRPTGAHGLVDQSGLPLVFNGLIRAKLAMVVPVLTGIPPQGTNWDGYVPDVGQLQWEPEDEYSDKTRVKTVFNGITWSAMIYNNDEIGVLREGVYQFDRKNRQVLFKDIRDVENYIRSRP